MESAARLAFAQCHACTYRLSDISLNTIDRASIRWRKSHWSYLVYGERNRCFRLNLISAKTLLMVLPPSLGRIRSLKGSTNLSPCAYLVLHCRALSQHSGSTTTAIKIFIQPSLPRFRMTQPRKERYCCLVLWSAPVENELSGCHGIGTHCTQQNIAKQGSTAYEFNTRRPEGYLSKRGKL